MKRVTKRLTALCLCALLLVCQTAQGAPRVQAAGTYTFTSTDVRTVLTSFLDYDIPDTPLGDQADRNNDIRIDSTDVRIMLEELMNNRNTVTLPQNVIRLSDVSDITDGYGKREYTVKAPFTDTYTLYCSKTSSITLSRGDQTIGTGTTSLTVSVKKGFVYTLTLRTRYANTALTMTATPATNKVTLPYEVARPMDTSGVNLYDTSDYVIAASNPNYQKRDGGTYVYCNNPEILSSDAIGTALMQHSGLTGDVYATFEHSNSTGSSLYLGYQLKNEGSSDVLITVTNVGYQTSGSWFGQKAWYDFYNTSFALPSDYYTNSSYDRDDLLFEDYTPRVMQPITYRLPAGKAFYVVGGTTSDAYRGISVGSTANQRVYSGACVNAAVKFQVTGGAVRGTLYAYTKTSQVSADPSPMPYRVDNNKYGNSYGVQYKGIADHAGVIDNYMSWTFNDNIGAGVLPATFTNTYDPNKSSVTTPYALLNNRTYAHNRVNEWATHINQQENHNAVGTDMVEFSCIDANGVSRVVDTLHNDGTGNAANVGNWMIEYQDHFTLINQGSKARNVLLHYQDNGALAMLVRDSQTGEVLKADFPVGKYNSDYNYIYTVTVPAHSVKQITMDYLLMPMSYGNVNHLVTIQ